MSQVIIYTGPEGNVHVCVPTGELHINEVKTKDTPDHSIIVDASTLPQGVDAQFFDAWELNGSTVTVNLEKARAFKLKQYNAEAVDQAQKRQLNTLAGIENTVSDADFVAKLQADRDAIAAATSTAELAAI